MGSSARRMSVDTAAIEMEAVAALSSRCRDPVYHLIIAYAKHETPTREHVVSDAERMLKAVGMEKNQYVLAAHKDTDDFHAHVIANRIGPDGKANDLWHERIIRERVCAELAAERGWDIVVGHHNRDIVQRIEHLHELPVEPQRRLSDGAYRRLHERGELPWQESARPYLLDAVDKARDWSDLRQRLGAHGVVVKLIRRGERVQGLAFAEGHDRSAPGCTASRIDRRCALSALERRFGAFTPEREPIAEIHAHGPGAIRFGQRFSLPSMRRSHGRISLNASIGWHRHQAVQRGARVQGLAFAQGEIPARRAVERHASIRVAKRLRSSSALGHSPKWSSNASAPPNRTFTATHVGPIAGACANARSMTPTRSGPGDARGPLHRRPRSDAFRLCCVP